MKLLTLLLLIVLICHFREANGQDGSGNGGMILPVLTVGFEQSAYTFYESRQEATPQICVSVSVESPNIDAVLEVTITSDTAQDGIDFVFNNTQLVIDERSVRECVIFTIINDEASEGGETLQAYLSLVYVLTNGTINNDSVVALTVDQANITIFDSIGFAVVPLSQTVLLNSEAESFSCASTPDFQALEIFWSINGQQVDNEQMPSGIQTTNNIDENTGALSSTLIVPTTLVYDNARVVCNLVSEGETSVSDPAVLILLFATLGFAENTYAISETARNLTSYIIVLSSTLPRGTNIAINISTASDLATGGIDFVPIMEMILLSDVSPGSRTSFTLTVIDDNDLELDETFFLLLDPLSPGVLINSTMAVVIIVDDDVHVGVGFDPVVYNVSEGEMAMLRVVLNTTTDQTITVFLLTQDGSGIASMDYETVTRTLTFTNSTEQIVPVLVNGDEITESRESFTAMLTNPTPSGTAFIATSTATINIIDQEVAVVRFSSNEYNVNEDDQNVQIGVQLLTVTERPIVVTLTLEPGSARSPGDYTSPDAIPVTLDPESAQVFVLVTIVDDSVYDGTKVFYATISSQSERVSIALNRTRIVISDNEVVYVWFNPIGYYVSEDASVATLTIERVGANGIPVNISITTLDINTTAGVDYRPISQPEVTFSPSLEQVTSLNVNITLIDDTSVTGEVKQFQVSLNSSQEGVLFASDNRTATINILDNDRVQIEIDFQKTDYAVSESYGSVAPIIVVEGNVSAPFDVMITARNGTASARRDYELLQSVLTINPGTPLYPIDVAIFENTIVEQNGFRSFSLVLSTTEGSVVFTNRTTVITIYDNDFSAPVVSVSNDISAIIVTDGQQVNFTCNVTTPVNGVDVTWLDGSGDVVSNSTYTSMGYNVIETIAGDSVLSVLMVSSFSLSEYIQGSFSCVGRVGNPLEERAASADTPPITSRLAAPLVSINLFPFSSRNITIGQNITVQCAISTDYGRPTDIDVIPRILWEVSYENNGERVINSFEATGLTVLTPAVFLASLDYAPVISARNFTCRSYVQPMLPNLRILTSETASDSRIVSPQAPALLVTVDPQPVIVIADVPPYNNYTLTCNATIPRDLIHLQVRFSIYRSSVIASANYTPVDDCGSVMFTGDRLCSYAVTFAEEVNLPDAPDRMCSVELLYVDSGTSEVISVARENASVLLLINIAAPPAPIFNYHVYGVSTELAVLHWIVSRITYTPEMYYIQYRQSSEEESDMIFTSSTVAGSSDLSARNVEYSIVLDGLRSGTFYVANIVVNNTVGGLISPDISFATTPLDIYRVVSDIDDTIPLGAPITIDFRFNGEGNTLPPDSSSALTFYPLFHVPAIEPTSIFYDIELQRTIVHYNHMSPSLSGEYVLCQEAGPPPSRRRRGVAPEVMRPRICGGRITISVTIPTLSVSTNLLIEQYVDNSYVGGDRSPSITCLPSDTRAPVRWRLSTGVYGDISDEYVVSLSPPSLNHTATFPVAYEILPRRSAFYICDLINVELPSGAEVSPQSITVRFIQTEVAILNSDMELPAGAVINQFNFGLDGLESFLSLNCLSVRGHPNLEWVSRDVSSLFPDGPISSLSSPNISVEYFAESDSQQRDTVLLVDPITQGLTGYYSCQSRQSGVSAEVYTTFTNPLWQLTSPTLNYIPIGSFLPVVSARYADFSLGYQNLGLGFSYSLTFDPYFSEPDMMLNQTNRSRSDSQQQFTSNRVTLISGRTGSLTGNNLTYLITGELGRFDGQYQLNATHLSSREEYSNTVEVRVIVPYFVEVDELVYSHIGDLVTLRCLPNDTMATVYWLRLTEGDETVISLDSDFTLSPPQRNHQLTLNATNLILRALGDDLPLQDRVYKVACGFVNGENTSNLISQMNVTVQLQEERIRMITSSSEVLIRNNTVVNRFTPPDGVLGSAFGESVPDLDLVTVGSLVVNCIATQGDHQPVWTSGSAEITDVVGSAVDSDMDSNGQVVVSNYTTRLQLIRINRQIEGNYFCLSQLSNVFTTFLLSTENPYIRAVSSSQLTVTEGESATLIFLIATDSDGATWNNEAVMFSFTNRSGVEYSINSNFQGSDPDFPQYFIYTISKAEVSNAGIYTASAPRRDCSILEETTVCGTASASIDLTVKTYCPQQLDGGILWPRTEGNSEVSRACNLAGSLFRQRTFTTRYCSEIGVWSDIDFSTCTLVTDPPPFLLMSFVLETGGEVSSLDDDDNSYLEAEMEGLLRDRGILFTEVTLQSSHFASISVTFEVTLSFTPSQDEQLVNFSNFFTASFTMLGNFTVRSGSRSLRQVSATDACPCQPSSDLRAKASLSFIELCSGVSITPCNCTSGLCQCSPPFVGDGERCTLDSDGDGYPDVALTDSPVCSDPEGTQELFCTQDNCPMVINADQDPFACQSDTDPVFNGCPFEIDSVWGITWPNTERNSSNVQLCPGGYDALGTASRHCNSDGQWEEANVLQCTTVEFIGLEELAQATVAILDPEEQIIQSAELTQQLIQVTEPQNRSLLPNDLQASTRVLTTVLQVLENNENATADLSVIDVFDNMLDVSQMDGWRTLQMAGLMNSSEVLLNNAERYGLLVASSVNESAGDDQSAVRQSRSNIVVTGNQYREAPESAVRFPTAADLVNYTKSSMDNAQINIPPSLIQERMTEMDDSAPLPVFFLLLRDLPMGAFLPNATNVPATTCMEEGTLTTAAATDVVAAQVGMGNNQFNPSQILQNDPVTLNFSFDTVANGSLYRCVYWNFSQPVGNGSWVITGVTTTDVTTSGNLTAIRCSSTHLTSFAVLVDVAGGLADVPDPERTALQIVSYIGCAVSILCLFGTVVFFLFQGSKLKTSVHYFVHLNLAFSLLLAFTVYVVGVETAIGSTGGCAFVAALLHYLFLSAFCWMLCEGIMLYLLLIVVFSKMSKKWWPFLLIGYLPPLPVVAVTVGVRYQYYGVRDNCGQLLYCWLSVEQGTIFGFVAPMLAIILINVVFLIMALYALFKTKKRQLRRKREYSEASRKTAKAIFTASIVLLPLLGLTWVFGILTVNVNTTAFAWLFTIFNSLQGAFIFFFHVVRSDQVWSKVSPKLQTLKRSTFSSAKWYDVSSAGTSTLSKGSTMKSTLKGRFGSLSRDPNSTLGRGDTYKKATVSQLSSQSPSSYELKTDLSPVSEHEAEEIGTGIETETKVDLSIPEKSISNETDGLPGSSLVLESTPKDEQKLISEKKEDNVEDIDTKTEVVDVAISSVDVIANPAMVSKVADKDTTNPERYEQETQIQAQSKADNESSNLAETPALLDLI